MKKGGSTHISGTNPLSGFIDYAFAEEVQGVPACCSEKVAERCPRELTDRNVIRQLCMTLWRCNKRGGCVQVRKEKSKRKEPRDCFGQGTRGPPKKAKADRCTYRPFLFGGRSKGTEGGLELIHVAFSWEVRDSKHQLRKDAADGPNVNRGTVVAATKQQFWRSIPSVGGYKRTLGAKLRRQKTQDTPRR